MYGINVLHSGSQVMTPAPVRNTQRRVITFVTHCIQDWAPDSCHANSRNLIGSIQNNAVSFFFFFLFLVSEKKFLLLNPGSSL